MGDFFVHETGICESTNIGSRTRIGAFSRVLPAAEIGRDCNLCDGVIVENEVVIGSRVTVKSGVKLCGGLRIEDDVFIGPNATFTNDRFALSKVWPEKSEQTTVRKGASIGANATILPGIEVGAGAILGAGAVVTRSVPPYAIAVGNPARIVGYVGADSASIPKENLSPKENTSQVVGVKLHELPYIRDMRGSLSVGEFGRSVPFEAKRYFIVFDVPGSEVRGEHAHRECQQFLVCVRGNCTVVADDGAHRVEFLLDRPTLGLYLPAMTWSTQYRYSPDALLLVFASGYYDASDYIRSYSDFKVLRSPELK